jgi:hypothetical protein
VGVQYPYSWRSWFDFAAKPLQHVIPDHIGIPLLVYLDLSGRSLHRWSGGRPKTGHLADASTLETTYISARGLGRIRSFLT